MRRYGGKAFVPRRRIDRHTQPAHETSRGRASLTGPHGIVLMRLHGFGSETPSQ